MKRKGAISQAYIERDRVVLPKLIRQAKHLTTYPTGVWKLYHIAAELPTDKFYISDEAAYSYIIRRFLHNDSVKFKNPYRNRLFEAFYQQVVSMMQQSKYKAMGLKNTTILALSRPAPCIGLSPGAIKNRISLLKCKKHE